jgi:hypothetical protein
MQVANIANRGIHGSRFSPSLTAPQSKVGPPCRPAYLNNPCKYGSYTLGSHQSWVVRAVTEEERDVNGANPHVNGSEPPAELTKAIQANGDLSAEHQLALGRIYQFLVQDGNTKAGLDANVTLQRLFETYQVLLWRPAELLNGRMAMIGFTAGAFRQALYGETVWRQVASTGGFAYLFAYGVILLAGVLNRQFGSPPKGIGPFTPTAELINGRAAMVGYAILAYTGYNIELTRTIVTLARQLAQSAGIPGVSA